MGERQVEREMTSCHASQITHHDDVGPGRSRITMTQERAKVRARGVSSADGDVTNLPSAQADDSVAATAKRQN